MDLSHTKEQRNILLFRQAGLSFSGMIRSNQTAGFIVECLKDEVTEEEIVEKMLAKYDATKEQITKDVGDILAKLRGIGAVEE